MTRDLAPRNVGVLLRDLEGGNGTEASPRLQAIPTGFDPLDTTLDGGFRAQDLALVGGQPGVGKTIVTLQWARQIALQGLTAIYACYEHDPNTLLARLLLMELGSRQLVDDPLGASWSRAAVRRIAFGGEVPADLLRRDPVLQAAYEQVSSYADRLWLVRASGAHTGLAELEALLRDHGDGRSVLFVDYLQKVAVRPEPAEEAEKVTRIAEGLKELALAHDAVVVSVVAADIAGLTAPRLRLHHLRGSSALAYEADVVLTLNDKFQIVSKVHLAYDTVKAETFKQHVVFSLEKNRGGPALLDLEFQKDFPHYRFDPKGAFVAERLVDERIVAE